ncbi:MAG: hypothetical protein H0W97_09330 [Actinobacteria bacterium]|nr:hypothetical protein [Actinomycetota bacterium]
MPKRLSALVAMTAMSTMLLFTGGSAIAAPPAPNVTIPDVTGTFPGGTFDGTFDLTRVVVRNGELVAVGSLSGTLTDALGNVVGTVTDFAVNLPLAVTGTCDILHLELGPLDLDLLGLVVHLDQVVLDITAESGPGNLLGNLLCAVAGLLDNNAPLNSIARLLNQLLGLLNLLG